MSCLAFFEELTSSWTSLAPSPTLWKAVDRLSPFLIETSFHGGASTVLLCSRGSLIFCSVSGVVFKDNSIVELLRLACASWLGVRISALITINKAAAANTKCCLGKLLKLSDELFVCGFVAGMICKVLALID